MRSEEEHTKRIQQAACKDKPPSIWWAEDAGQKPETQTLESERKLSAPDGGECVKVGDLGRLEELKSDLVTGEEEKRTGGGPEVHLERARE